MSHIPREAIIASCPAFRFENFELAKRDELSGLYPQHGELIERMCKV